MRGARNRDRGTIPTDVFLEPRQQAQWDAFFRRLAPRCLAFQRIVAEAYRQPTDELLFQSAFPTEMPSARVADALHKPTKFTELRADGIYLPVSGEPVVAYEFQSTFNSGMQIRFAMYGEAFAETQEENGYVKRPRFVQIYSGKSNTDWAQENHRKFIEGYARYLLIFLDAMDAEDFNGDSLEGQVIRLSRRQENDIKLFVSLRDAILSLSPSDRRAMLLRSLVIASLNKPAIAIRIIGEWTLDPDLAEGLAAFLPALQKKLIDEERNRANIKILEALEREKQSLRTAIAAIVNSTGGPPALLNNLENCDHKRLYQVLGYVNRNAQEGWPQAPGNKI